MASRRKFLHSAAAGLAAAPPAAAALPGPPAAGKLLVISTWDAGPFAAPRFEVDALRWSRWQRR